ncbi:hypothetical protein E2562_010268, partial [Oryza meyeriana var. granulata]
GVGIIACVGENELWKFSMSIVEGHAYFLRNFRVSRQTRKFNAVPSTFTIFFTPWTIVEEMPTEIYGSLTHYIFNFVDFEDLEERAKHPNGLVDVIGQLTVVHPLIHSNILNGLSVRWNVELQDL